jgi:hypothetical protein
MTDDLRTKAIEAWWSVLPYDAKVSRADLRIVLDALLACAKEPVASVRTSGDCTDGHEWAAAGIGHGYDAPGRVRCSVCKQPPEYVADALRERVTTLRSAWDEEKRGLCVARDAAIREQQRLGAEVRDAHANLAHEVAARTIAEKMRDESDANHSRLVDLVEIRDALGGHIGETWKDAARRVVKERDDAVARERGALKILDAEGETILEAASRMVAERDVAIRSGRLEMQELAAMHVDAKLYGDAARVIRAIRVPHVDANGPDVVQHVLRGGPETAVRDFQRACAATKPDATVGVNVGAETAEAIRDALPSALARVVAERDAARSELNDWASELACVRALVVTWFDAFGRGH